MLAYLVLNHRGMVEGRDTDDRAAQAEFDAAVRSAASSGGPAGEIERAKALLDSGTIKREFEEIKARALAGHRAVAGTGA
ncbi:MAG: hypothetical protein JO243_08025 [Solirubrobacterales bacterium]|nr:hypothetical protein [Solirubrobacterales bacterium]